MSRLRLDVLEVDRTGERIYRLVIPRDALISARLDAFDRALLGDCEKPDATIADTLLALETLVRRIEEEPIVADHHPDATCSCSRCLEIWAPGANASESVTTEATERPSYSDERGPL